MSKIESRKRRGLKTKARIRLSDRNRLVVYRSSKHIYAQVVYDGKVLAQSSTCDKEIRSALEGKSKVEQAVIVGTYLANRALENGIKEVGFDRNGMAYHGRIKALAEAAREAGMVF